MGCVATAAAAGWGRRVGRCRPLRWPYCRRRCGRRLRRLFFWLGWRVSRRRPLRRPCCCRLCRCRRCRLLLWLGLGAASWRGWWRAWWRGRRGCSSACDSCSSARLAAANAVAAAVRVMAGTVASAANVTRGVVPWLVTVLRAHATHRSRPSTESPPRAVGAAPGAAAAAPASSLFPAEVAPPPASAPLAIVSCTRRRHCLPRVSPVVNPFVSIYVAVLARAGPSLVRGTDAVRLSGSVLVEPDCHSVGFGASPKRWRGS